MNPSAFYKTAFIVALVTFFSSYSYAQEDSLLHVFHSKASDSTRINALLYYAENYLDERNTDSIIELGEDAVRLSDRIEDQRFLAKSLRILALGYIGRRDIRTSTSYAEQALDVIINSGYRREVHEAFLLLEHIDFTNLNYSEAIHICNNHILWAEKEGIDWIKAEALKRLADVYYQTEEFELALEYGKKSFALFDKLEYPQRTSQVEMVIADCYEALGEYGTALNHYRSVRDSGLKLSASTKLTLDFQIAACLFGLNPFLHVPETYFECLKEAREIESTEVFADITSEIAKTFLELDFPDSAVYYASLGLKESEAYGHSKQFMKNMKYLIEANKRLGNFEDAFVLQEKFNQYSDSLLSQEQEEAMLRSQLNADFHKERLVNRARQEAQLQQQKFIIWSVLGAFLLLSILAYSISAGRKRANGLLLNILPPHVAAELKSKGYADPKEIERATILFTDFKGFTAKSSSLNPAELVAEIDDCFRVFDTITEKYGIEKIKTIGDAYMAVGGLDTKENTAKNVVLAALEMQDFIINRGADTDREGLLGFEMRAGIHTGPVVAGIVGLKKFQYDIWGDSVNTASRMESNGEVGKVNISQATHDLLKYDHEFSFESRGKIEAKGKGEIEMYFVKLA